MEKKKNKGITLIALVITIIVLLILAGVAIATLTGENGLLIKSTQSSELTQKEKTKERIGLSVEAAMIEGEGSLIYSNLDKELENEFEKGNYTLYRVGKGYLIIVDNVDYKVDEFGTLEDGKDIIQSTIDYAGDLSKNGEYDGTTKETAFRINCIEDLVEWSNNYSKYNSSYIVLERMLDFESIHSYNDYKKIETDINGNGEKEPLITELTTGTGFTPISSFYGTFDGKDNEIRNLYENRTGDGGLILLASQIEISNLGVTGEIKATGNVAGFIASSNLSNTVKNSYNKCNIKSETGIAGGIIGNAGVNSTYIVYNCYNEGSIDGKTYAGGIMGLCHGDGCSTYIYNCYNIGEVKSEEYAGGIWGKLYRNEGRNISKLL